MSNPIPQTAIRPARTLRDVHGLPVDVHADCDGVAITIGGRTAILGPAERAAFDQLYVAASHEAEAWAQVHGGDDE